MGGSISDENTRLPVTIPKELKDRAAFVAKCEHRSLSNLIVTVLSTYVDQHFPLYNLLFDQDGKEKNGIDTEELQNITNRMMLFGATGSGKSMMLDHLLKNMYFNEQVIQKDDE